ncbi:hypothetical protein [Comamonas sp. NoAH]|uniref:hypothetical protein n=1 Tax=Comamonas halotolerans TaxID=3041496 RepID=UPI0024E0FB29|nr:hypothetical protein [Comamonas sp. NoAH]
MMKYSLVLILLFNLITTTQGREIHTEFIRTGNLEAQIVNIGPGCRIKLDIPKGAKLGQGYQNKQYRGMAGFSIKMPKYFSHNGDWSFSFNCYHTYEKNFQEVWKDRSPKNGVKFIIEKGRKKFTDDEGATYFSVQSVNAEGWALTYDDTTGEERLRLRHLWYCVKAKESAICGSSDIGYIDFINNKKNIDIASYAFRVLESIEFLEDVPPN